MGRYANVGNGYVVQRARFKHTPEVIQEPTEKQKKAYATAMNVNKNLEKKYKEIRELEQSGLLDVIWNDGRVSFSKVICGVDYQKYVNWLQEQTNKLDFWIASNEVKIHICKGTGDNLLDEDINGGFVDYIYYDVCDLNDNSIIDGGLVLIRTCYVDLSMEQIIKKVLNMEGYKRKDFKIIKGEEEL